MLAVAASSPLKVRHLRAAFDALPILSPAVLYAGVASGGIAFTLQIMAQRRTPPAEAALLMSLESVFAALAAALVLHEHLTSTAALGCLLILIGAVMVELAPTLRALLRSVFPG